MKSYGICPVCGTRLEVKDYFTKNENKMNKKQLLAIMIQNFALDNTYPLSVLKISKQEGVTYYQVRKCMNELREEGLVKYATCYIKGIEENFLIQGWVITDKCKELEEYKKAKEWGEKVRGYEYEIRERGKRKNISKRNRK